MKIFLIFFLIPIYGIGQLTLTEESILKNQTHLLASKNIKQILISGKNNFTVSISLRKDGTWSELLEYCSDTIFLSKINYDANGNEIHSIQYDYKCNGNIEYQSQYIYDDTLLIETINKDKNELYSTSSKTFYDTLARKVKYINNNGFFNTIGFWEEFNYPNDSTRTKLRINQDSTLISKEISLLNSDGLIIKSSYFHNGRQTSWYEYSYNEDLILTREAGFFNPSNELIMERLTFFNSQGKIIEVRNENSSGKKRKVFKYNQTGLLIKLIEYKNESSNSNNYTFFKYNKAGLLVEMIQHKGETIYSQIFEYKN